VASRSAWAGDPKLSWYTLKTPHFNVHFHGGLERDARRTAALAEQIQLELVRWLGHLPSEPTEILLTDSADSANGFANVLPYSALRLYVAAPEDMSPLGEYDDWLATLVAHEQTHVIQTDTTSGIPALVNSIIGKTVAPNQLQPRWLREGLAVLAETRLSGGGRLRSPLFDMQMRADVLEDNFARLDQLSGYAMRWPRATLWYLYGAKFVEYLDHIYGPAIFAAMAADTGDDVIPFAVSRPMLRVTGRTVEQLYDGFRTSSERHYREQAAAIEARGLREGRRITWHGGNISSPRFVPPQCIAAKPGDLTVSYFRDDGDERAGHYLLALSDDGENERLLTRASGTVGSWSKRCELVFDSVAPSRRQYYFHDLYLLKSKATSRSGTGPSRRRLTVGRRAREPDLAPDGRTVAYVTNRAGTTTLRLAKLSAARQLQGETRLQPSAQNEQVFTPRFSPDGRYLAYGVWTAGGYRDLRILELATGRVIQPWKDRAIDRQPSWSPDGQSIYFSSSRSGVPNIYNWRLSDGAVRQVTNVRTGAFMPEVSPDGATLVYVGYGSEGFDLYAMEIDESTWLKPLPPQPEPGDRIILEERYRGAVWPYSPWNTLRPRALGLDYRTDTSGSRLILSADGSDIVGLHSISASAVFETEGAGPDLYLQYRYRRLPVGMYVSVSRESTPSNRYSYGSSNPEIVEIRTGASTGLQIPMPEEFQYQSLNLAYAVTRLDARLPTGTAADPYATVPVEPRRGMLGAFRLGYAFSNTESYVNSLGRERGLSVDVFVERADQRLGSDFDGTSVVVHSRGYLKIPSLRHHVLALGATLGVSDGPGASSFGLGGYQDSELLRNVLNGVPQSRVTLRGYAGGRFRGTHLWLTQAEYRFPLAWIDSGLSTLPVFLRRIGAAFGADYGGAFNSFEANHPGRSMHLGLASELWFDLTLGYRIDSRLAFGYALGTDEEALPGGTAYLLVVSAL